MWPRWMDIKTASDYLSCSTSTIRRYIESGVLNMHEMAGELKRLDREQIDGMFIIPNRGLPKNRGIVSAEEERRYVRRVSR